MSFFSKFFQSNDQSVLGIDIGTSSIKVVELKRKSGQAQLTTYGELALGPYAHTEIGRATSLPPETLGSALKDLLKECKATAKDCGVAIPFGASLVSTIEIPQVTEKELATIIPIEARKYIPVPISEVSLDWSVIPKEKTPATENSSKTEFKENQIKDKIDVLTVAIHNDTLHRFGQIIDTAGLQASFYEIEIFSSIRALLENDPAPVMILDMGAATTKLYVVERGIIRNSHTINRGSQDLTLALAQALNVTVEHAEMLKRGLIPAKEGQNVVMDNIFSTTLTYIFSEADRVILNYQKRFNKNLSRVYLVGGGVKLRGFLDASRKGLETDVLPGDPFSKVETPAFLESMLKVTGPEFTVAVGLALRRLQELG